MTEPRLIHARSIGIAVHVYEYTLMYVYSNIMWQKRPANRHHSGTPIVSDPDSGILNRFMHREHIPHAHRPIPLSEK